MQKLDALTATKRINLLREINGLSPVEVQARCDEWLTPGVETFSITIQSPDNIDGEVNEEALKVFCQAVRNSKIKSINFLLYDLDMFEMSSCKMLFGTLEAPELKHFGLGQVANDNYWDNADPQYLFALMNILGKTKISDIEFYNLDNCDHVDTFWVHFNQLIVKPHLYTLTASSWHRENIEDSQWDGFLAALANSHLKKLSMGTELDYLNAEAWHKFAQSVGSSQLEELYLPENNFTPQQWDALASTSSEQFSLRIVSAYSRPSPQMQQLLDRNIALRSVCKEAASFISYDTTSNYLFAVNACLQKLVNAMGILQGKESRTAISMRNELQHHLDNLHWKKGCFLRDNLKANDSYTHEDLMAAVEPWLEVSEMSPYFETSRMEAFQLLYSCIFDNCKDSNDAFITALQACIGQHDQLIALSETNQIIFDGYLFAAAGGKGNLVRELPADTRLSLLKYVILTALKPTEDLPHSKSSLNVVGFFAQNSQTNIDNLLEAVPLISAHNLDPNTIKKLDVSWNKIVECLSQSLQCDHDKIKLLQSVNKLSDCTLMAVKHMPTTKEEIMSLPLKSSRGYVYDENKKTLWFVDKYTLSCDECLTPELETLINAVQPTAIARVLSKQELKQMTSAQNLLLSKLS